MPSGYQPLSTNTDRDRELNEAFDDDEDEDNAHETTPLAGAGLNGDYNAPSPATPHSTHSSQNSLSGSYDFEREYDWMAPPPGSPTRPSATALPNDYGNSNGVPLGQVAVPERSISTGSRPSFFRRAMGAILPTHYAPLPTSDAEASSSSGQRRGGGTENDGVFANLMGKPAPATAVRNENGEVHMVPESVQKEVPPTYSEAQADSVPPYWETTIHAPAIPTADGEMVVDDLPSGSFLTFIITLGISFFFQFVGFLLTYLLHTSHAGKYGSRAGLGLTLIQYGFYSKVSEPSSSTDNNPYGSFWGRPHFTTTAEASTATGNVLNTRDADEAVTPGDDSYVVVGGFSTKDWLSFILMTIGWFLLLSSVLGFLRVKRWEKKIRESANPQSQPTHSAEDMQRDQEIRQNLERVFGFGAFGASEAQDEQELLQHHVRDDGHGNVIVIPNQQLLEEARLTRDLRAAGLL